VNKHKKTALLPCKCGHNYEEHNQPFGGIDIRSALHCGIRGLEPTGACEGCHISTKKSQGYKCWGFIEINNLDYIEHEAKKRGLIK
jgi:hypothetical protein